MSFRILFPAIETVQPEVVEFSQLISQSKPIFEAFQQVQITEGPRLNEACQRVVELQLRESRLRGIGLPPEQQCRFNDIQKQLSQLSHTFSNNLLDGSKAFSLLFTDRERLAGLPSDALAYFAQSAKSAGHVQASELHGPWVVTCDAPSYLPIMQHARDRDLREAVYTAYVTRASDCSPHHGVDKDNHSVICELLRLKWERAELLGFASPAHVSMASKMASLESARALLHELREASLAAALKEHTYLTAFAHAQGFVGELRQWDIPFFAEQLRQATFQFSESELKAYFPHEQVLRGLFALTERLFGVRVRLATTDTLTAQVWDPLVQVHKAHS